MKDSAVYTGKVFLIGAGPGDPKLLTLRAAEVLGISDVIVYDHLVNPEVLAHSRRGAELIYAGKRASQHTMSQTQINNLLIEQALDGRLVSRLKGGDPFIFGRGGEEAEALAEAGIPWEVVPGVSSGVAAAAYAGIPLTHRDYSSSVAFVAGRRAAGYNAAIIDPKLAAGAADTLVIFMCSDTIADIAKEAVACGRPPSTPAAIIRWGTYGHQEVFAGTLDQLIEAAGAGNSLAIEPPAIAIIGEVASLAEKLNWFGAREPAQPFPSIPNAPVLCNERVV